MIDQIFVAPLATLDPPSKVEHQRNLDATSGSSGQVDPEIEDRKLPERRTKEKVMRQKILRWKKEVFPPRRREGTNPRRESVGMATSPRWISPMSRRKLFYALRWKLLECNSERASPHRERVVTKSLMDAGFHFGSQVTFQSY
jgi:hypothetical protein